jgi:hypothetical protein
MFASDVTSAWSGLRCELKLTKEAGWLRLDGLHKPVGERMIETAWDEYRAWAACARALQRSSQNWNTAALASAAAAAVFGAGAIQAANHPQLAQFGPALSLAAAAAARAVPILGKESSRQAPSRNGSAPARPRRPSNQNATGMRPGWDPMPVRTRTTYSSGRSDLCGTNRIGALSG